MADESIVVPGKPPTALAIPAGPHAFIYNCRHEYKVHSPAIVNGRSGKFWIRNLTAHAAVVTLPEAVVGKRTVATELDPGEAKQIQLFTGAKGGHTYSVVMRVDGDLVTGQGNSDPVIIIDPPAS